MRRHIAGCTALLAMIFLTSFGGCSKSGTDAGNSPTASQGTDNQLVAAKGGATTSVQAVPPEVVLETTQGSITIRLNPAKSPRTVENFVAHVKSHFYDQTIFHRVDKGERVFGGAYNDRIEPKIAGIPIFNEAHNGVKNRRYTVAMHRNPDDSDSATTVFFINAADNPGLDFTERTPENYGYCVFGEVVEGKDVVDRIGAVDVKDIENSPPAQRVVIKSAKQTK